MIQRACEDVYSSFASSAFASASTVDRNVRSRLSKLEALAIAELDLVRDAGQQPHAALVEGAAAGLAPNDDAGEPVRVDADRSDGDGGLRQVGAPSGNRGRGGLERLVPAEQLACPLMGKDDRPQQSGVLRAEADERTQPELLAGAVLEPERRARPVEEARRQLDRALEDLVERLGGRQPPAEVEQRVGDVERVLGPLGLEPLCLVEARVLDRDGRVAAEHLEQADVVLVELGDAELGDDDRADHPRAVAERDGDHRLVHVVRAGDRLGEVAVERVVEQDRLAGACGTARDPLADAAAERLDALLGVRVEVAAPRHGDEVVALDDVEAAAVVVDEHPELVDDRLADLADVVQPVQLAGEALEHLQMRDRADVAARGARVRPLAVVLLEEHRLVLAARLRGHHRDLRAGHELARVHRVLRALGDADGHGQPACGLDVGLRQAVGDPACEPEGVAGVAGGHDDAELLAAEAADDV